MKDRIAHIMRAKNLKASDFANLLGIQPSGVSHILAGRNQPSLDFVKKIKETFPEYNLDWIIFGIGPMTNSESAKESFAAAQQELPLEPLTPPLETLRLEPEGPFVAHEPSLQPTKQPNSSAIKSVMVLYEDGSFEAYTPR